MVWKSVDGAYTSSSEVNEDSTKTVSNRDLKLLKYALGHTSNGRQISLSRPLEGIPEDRPQFAPDAILPGERDEHNPANDEPLSAHGDVVPPPPANLDWEPSQEAKRQLNIA